MMKNIIDEKKNIVKKKYRDLLNRLIAFSFNLLLFQIIRSSDAASTTMHVADF